MRANTEVKRGDIFRKGMPAQSTTEDAKAAHKAVYEALKAGILVRPTVCSKCGWDVIKWLDDGGYRGDDRQYHHINHQIRSHHWSYLPEHRLDVEWLCLGCHAKAHYDKHYYRTEANADLLTKESANVMWIKFLESLPERYRPTVARAASSWKRKNHGLLSSIDIKYKRI